MTVTIEATLQPDGTTLRLDRKLALPPGKVVVTVQPVADRDGPGMLEVLDRIQANRRLRGAAQLTDEEMAAEIAALRADDDEAEARWREIWSRTAPPAAGSD